MLLHHNQSDLVKIVDPNCDNPLSIWVRKTRGKENSVVTTNTTCAILPTKGEARRFQITESSDRRLRLPARSPSWNCSGTLCFAPTHCSAIRVFCVPYFFHFCGRIGWEGVNSFTQTTEARSLYTQALTNTAFISHLRILLKNVALVCGMLVFEIWSLTFRCGHRGYSSHSLVVHL